MLLRRSIISIVSALVALLAGALGAVNIEAVAIKHFSDKQLTTLGEYFGGKEYCGRRTYLRIVPTQKRGMYLVTALDTPISDLPKGATITIDYYLNSSGEMQTTTLPFSQAKGHMGKALYFGLSNITNSEEKLLAWRLTINDGAGYPLAHYESFLWRMPEKNK